jgi:AraC-like DNA-binding protein
MADSPPEDPFLRFSTDEFPVRERLSAWQETYARNVIRVEPHPHEGHPFRSRLKLCALPDIGICYGETTAATYKRTKALTTSDEFVLLIFRNGIGSAFQRKCDTRFEDGDATLLSGADVGETQHPASSRYLAVALPHGIVAPMIRDPASLLARKIPGSNEAIRLLSGYLGSIEASGDGLSPAARKLISTHIVDLAASALGALHDYHEMAQRRGVRAARLRAVKQEIAANCGSASFSVESVAHRLGISPRYIRRLFEDEQTTFTDYTRNRRLDRACRLLSADPFSLRTITAIALDAGFGDISHFNHAFRRRFHKTPSDVRAEAAQRKGLGN